jgi:lysophospholipase L1-like esterase
MRKEGADVHRQCRIWSTLKGIVGFICLGLSPWTANADVFTLNEPPRMVAECFADTYVNHHGLGADYDLFMPTVGSHCYGTNHQDIDRIERVVFLGDSITVGTPPTRSTSYYRSQLADALADRFSLSYGEFERLWKGVNPFDGTSIVREAGNFASCARWGAKNVDLLRESGQLERCFPPDKRNLRTLVVMTSGGNDLAKLTRNAIDGATEDELWMQTMEMVQLEFEIINWLVGDPAKFPHGIFVIFANIYEFSDGTGDVQSCDISGLVGFDEPLPIPEQLVKMLVWANEQYLSIAVESGTDMIFMAEAFCGHGFNHDDPTAPCYRGPEIDRWFDLTCIHPNPTGHSELANMFLAVVDE